MRIKERREKTGPPLSKRVGVSVVPEITSVNSFHRVYMRVECTPVNTTECRLDCSSPPLFLHHRECDIAILVIDACGLSPRSCGVTMTMLL
jgi:hypothetical protein